MANRQDNTGFEAPTPMTPLGLYIHVPFCDAKCGYCDFFSVVPRDAARCAALIDRLVNEIGQRLGTTAADPMTVFVGGGTPTALPLGDLTRLLAAAGRHAPNVREFTVEANPESLGPEQADQFVAAGVNRVSLGAQSFETADLQMLDRVHTPGAVAAAVDRLRHIGITNINLDLIFGIPGQSLAGWKTSLASAVDLGVDHLSCYSLTYEPDTPLTEHVRRGVLPRCDESIEAEMYHATIDHLTEAGFEHYEVSNFARPGRRCEHNMIYWRHDPYVGIGPSAAGYLHGCRYRNIPDIDEYIRRIDRAGHAEAERERLTGRALAGEMAMLGLRLIEGVDLAAVRARCGVDLRAACASIWSRYADRGLVAVGPDRIALTRDGLLLADTIIADVLEACGKC
jgi:oxygen-independent coproporphyrinogen-3 oxidase